MDKLGKSQSVIYEYLKQEIRQKGYPPSVREICRAVGLNSTSTVHEHLNQLEKKRYIKRDPTKPRAIEILEPDFYSYRRELIEIPIIGKVTAGEPILAVENIEGSFPVPSEYVKGNDVFMLRVQGESMIEAGILDKDLIMVRKQPVAINGEIVVALLDDSATVKRYFKEQNHFRLQPENSAMSPIIVDDVSIIGVVIGLFRSM